MAFTNLEQSTSYENDLLQYDRISFGTVAETRKIKNMFEIVQLSLPFATTEYGNPTVR